MKIIILQPFCDRLQFRGSGALSSAVKLRRWVGLAMQKSDIVGGARKR